MDNMKEKKYTHVQAAKMAAAFLLEIYYEIDSTAVSKGTKSKISGLTQTSNSQNESLYYIVSDLDFYFAGEWWQSLIRTGICKDASEIASILLSADETLDVIYDLIEFSWALDSDFAFLLLVIKKTKENDIRFLEAISLWRRLNALIVDNPNYVFFNEYLYLNEVNYSFTPLNEEVKLLSLEKKKIIDDAVKVQFEEFLKNSTLD